MKNILELRATTIETKKVTGGPEKADLLSQFF